MMVAGQTPKEGGRKNDSAKLRYDLIPTYPLRELAKVYTIGANKYGDKNYMGGLAWSRVISALMRHLEAWRDGEELDPEDGQHHLSSVAWCAFTLMLYERYALGTDDRPPLWTEVTVDQFDFVPLRDQFDFVPLRDKAESEFAFDCPHDRLAHPDPQHLPPICEDCWEEVY